MKKILLSILSIAIIGCKNPKIDVVSQPDSTIKSITDNKITVLRGQDGSTITEHLRGAPVRLITAADNALIEEGDDFGFSGTIS